MESPLPTVPEFDIASGGALALARAAPQVAQAQIDDAERRFTRLGVHLADALSRRWLAASASTLQAEIADVADEVGRPGAYLLNLSYEWGCTAGVAPDPGGEGMRLLRTLDWPFDGLGRGLLAARMEGPAGRWLNLTWAGFAGVLTALCPGRFALAFNQPPMRARRLGPLGMPMPLDWALNRLAMARRHAEPPAHLLRRICEQAASYDEARARILETPVAAPFFVSLAGPGPAQGCVIEHDGDHGIVHAAPAAIANHWLSPHVPGHPRTGHSRERLAAMMAVMTEASGLSWLQWPVLNAETRVAAVLSPATGGALVQGWEADGPATQPTWVDA